MKLIYLVNVRKLNGSKTKMKIKIYEKKKSGLLFNLVFSLFFIGMVAMTYYGFSTKSLIHIFFGILFSIGAIWIIYDSIKNKDKLDYHIIECEKYEVQK